jgi:tetratricopeptide (TPR) repeat protein
MYLDETAPAMIMVNKVNPKRNNLEWLLRWIRLDYEAIGGFSEIESSRNLRYYARRGDAAAYLAAAGMHYAAYRPSLMEADLLVMRGCLDEAEAAYRRAASQLPTDAEPLIFLGDLYLSRGKRDLALEAYNAAAQRRQGTHWSYIALGNYYASLGEDEQATDAFRTAARYAKGPVSTLLPLLQEAQPALLPPRGLHQIEHPLGLSVGERLFILGYDITPTSPAPGKQARLTLYWWSPAESPSAGTVNIRWLTAAGEVAGAQHTYPTVWEPGYALRWTYDLPAPADAAPGQLLQLQVQLMPGKQQEPITSRPFASIIVR